MKKVMFTAVAAMAMMAMVACNNNKNAEAVEEPVAEEQVEKAACCAEQADSAMCCKAEGMAEESACCQKAEGEKCCKAEGKECPKEAAK